MSRNKTAGQGRRRSATTANPALARAMHGLRSSSAATPHIPKPSKGTRSSRQAAAIRDQQNGSVAAE